MSAVGWYFYFNGELNELNEGLRKSIAGELLEWLPHPPVRIARRAFLSIANRNIIPVPQFSDRRFLSNCC